MELSMVLIIADCKNGPELWAKIAKYCRSMIDGIDGKSYVTFEGRTEDAAKVFGFCALYGACEVYTTPRG